MHWRLRSAYFLFGAILLGIVLSDHRVHALAALPYVALLACLGMHLVHHGAHRSRRAPPSLDQPSAASRPLREEVHESCAPPSRAAGPESSVAERDATASEARNARTGHRASRAPEPPIA